MRCLPYAHSRLPRDVQGLAAISSPASSLKTASLAGTPGSVGSSARYTPLSYAATTPATVTASHGACTDTAQQSPSIGSAVAAADCASPGGSPGAADQEDVASSVGAGEEEDWDAAEQELDEELAAELAAELELVSEAGELGLAAQPSEVELAGRPGAVAAAAPAAEDEEEAQQQQQQPVVQARKAAMGPGEATPAPQQQSGVNSAAPAAAA